MVCGFDSFLPKYLRGVVVGLEKRLHFIDNFAEIRYFTGF